MRGGVTCWVDSVVVDSVVVDSVVVDSVVVKNGDESVTRQQVLRI
jgi:hypothetical protein